MAVLRKGEFIGDVAAEDANHQSMTDMMVGRSVSLNIDRPEPGERQAPSGAGRADRVRMSWASSGWTM